MKFRFLEGPPPVANHVKPWVEKEMARKPETPALTLPKLSRAESSAWLDRILKKYGPGR